MKTILAIIPILFLLYSCEDKVYFNIPKDEKPLLNNGDTIFFIDSTNQNIDSFIVKITDEYEVSDKRYYHELITIKYSNLKKTNSNNFNIQHMSSTSISASGFYYPTIYGNENVVSINLSGVNYSSVYIMHYNDFPDTIPKTVYYTHKQGIIKYDFSDTLFYMLKKK